MRPFASLPSPRASSRPAFALPLVALLAACSSSGIDATSSSSGGGGSPATTGSVAACSDPAAVGIPPSPCTPSDPSCGADLSACLATDHAQGATSFLLRMVHLTLSAPAWLAAGAGAWTMRDAVSPRMGACGLGGSGALTWLLRFDLAAGTLETGVADVSGDAQEGYRFLDRAIADEVHDVTVAPLKVATTLDPTCGLTSEAGDLNLPLYADPSGIMLAVLPLRALRFVDTKVSLDHDCIGRFDPSGLLPDLACSYDPQDIPFVDGGHLEAFITLEDADATVTTGTSLCVRLSEQPSMYGDGGDPRRCKRDGGGAIVFKGDWCAATNQPATATCADAVRFAGSFAASGTHFLP
jgi:hypothetical protein